MIILLLLFGALLLASVVRGDDALHCDTLDALEYGKLLSFDEHAQVFLFCVCVGFLFCLF